MATQKFDFSFYTSKELTDPKTGDKIHYLNLYECDNSNRYEQNRIFCPGGSVAVKRKDHQTNEKLLVYLKLGFVADKQRNNEQATISLWKQLHRTISFDSNQKQPFELCFVNFSSRNPESTKNLANSSTAPNCGVFLWDPENANKLNASNSYAYLKDTEIFSVGFGCYSTQFPIKVENKKYVGSLFELSVEIYSLESKQKLDSFTYKLKISRNFDTQYDADLNVEKKLTESKDEPSKDVIEQNLNDLLSSLSIQTLPAVNPLPSFEQLNQIKLDQAYFTYEIPKPCVNQYILPVVFMKFDKSYKGDKISSKITIKGDNFKPGNEGELVKTIFTLGLNKEFTPNEWLQNWQRMNGSKSLLQHFPFYRFKYYDVDTTLFDNYSSAVNQFCLIWMPSMASENFTIEFNVCDDNELDHHKFECYLKVESFQYEDNVKIDEAICRIEFNNTYPTNGLTQHKVSFIKNDAKYLVKKVLFISVDGSDYVPLSFQQFFVEQFNADQFKARLVSLIQRIKNIDPFQSGSLKHFKFDQTDNGQGANFNAAIFNSLEPNAALKCVLRKVSSEGSMDHQQKLAKYDIDLINQQ